MRSATFTEYFGIVGRTHGVDGTVVLIDTVGLPVQLKQGDTIGVGYSRDFAQPYILSDFQSTPQRTLMKLQGVSTPEAAAELVDKAVFVSATCISIVPEDRYLVGDIEGATVIAEDGTILGKISEVWLLPANDVWVLQTADGTLIPLPVIDDVILAVDIESKLITARLLDGLTDLLQTTREPDDD